MQIFSCFKSKELKFNIENDLLAKNIITNASSSKWEFLCDLMALDFTNILTYNWLPNIFHIIIG